MGFNFATGAGKVEPKKGGKFDNGLENLPDSTDAPYQWFIEKAEAKDAGERTIVTLELMVIGGKHDGHKGRRDSFIKSMDDLNRFAGDTLEPLGFDPKAWVKEGVAPESEAGGKYFQDCMMRAIACMQGLKFEGKKKANKSGEKTYQNVYIDKRLDDGKPLKITPAEMEAILTLNF